MNKAILWMIVLMLSLVAVAAQENETNSTPVSKLEISALNIVVKNPFDDSENKYKLSSSSIKVQPGSTMSVEVEAKNLFNSTEDIDMEDVELEVIIFDIDDGDDLDDDATFKDISPGKKQKATVDFKIPLLLESGDYDMQIIIYGTDSNGTEHRAELTKSVRSDKEKHHLYLERFDLSTTRIKCEESAEIRYVLWNLGRDDEDDVLISLKQDGLNLNYQKETDIDADDDPFKDTIRIYALGVKPGTYSLLFNVDYDDGSENIQRASSIIVDACEAVEAPVQQPPQSTQTTTTMPSVQQDVPTQPTQPVIVQYNELPPGSGVFASTVEPSFFEKNQVVVLVIAALLGIALIAWAIKR